MLQFSLFALNLNGIPEQSIDNIRMLSCDSHVCLLLFALFCFSIKKERKVAAIVVRVATQVANSFIPGFFQTSLVNLRSMTPYRNSLP